MKSNIVAKKRWRGLNFHISCLKKHHWDITGATWKRYLNKFCQYLGMDIKKSRWKYSEAGMRACMLSCFSHVQLFVTLRTVALKVPLSKGIVQARIPEWVATPSSRGSSQPRKPTDRSPPGSSVHGNSPGKNTRVGCHALLQGIFPTQGQNLYLKSPKLAGTFFTTNTTWEAWGRNIPTVFTE